MLTNIKPSQANRLRDDITKAYRMDENTSLGHLIPDATLPAPALSKVASRAEAFVIETRAFQKKRSKLDLLLHQYDLSTEEGIALMCMAEALLRIPDKATMDKFISDKLSTASFKNHLSKDNPLFINAATWSLILTGSVYSPLLNPEKSLIPALKRSVSKLGTSMIRPVILQMMKAIGKQFVMGQTIQQALEAAKKNEAEGYRYSFDMLGEAARTHEDAKTYYQSYADALEAIGQVASGKSVIENPGISVKLSALHPRYEYLQQERVMQEIPPLLLTLAQQAKKYNIGLTIDAEEADRFDLMLDIFEAVYKHPSLDGWHGLGLVIQAYQKRAPYAINWLADLAKEHGKRIMIRLVKGAYWDYEIKISQVQGYSDYPVFTRKNATDVSYLACAKKLLSMQDYFYPQFGTHNAYSVSAIMEMAGDAAFEFQCLYGMGQPLYHQIVDKSKYNMPCRIYAPVGTHKDLLGYLVRRLLENGANSSFVNKLADESAPMSNIIFDPVAVISKLENKRHPKIPLPKNIYGNRLNSAGLDLSDRDALAQLKTQMEKADNRPWRAGSIIDGKTRQNDAGKTAISPANGEQVLGVVHSATEEDVIEAINIAEKACHTWGRTSPAERADILERAADIIQREMPALMTILCREGGKCTLDAIGEVRETIDFCRFYAMRAREDLATVTLPGPTGELNTVTLHPRGIVGCISPWNFSLAIFCGQVVAALAAGNTVLTKPAEQTPFIAYKAVQLLHEAGVPTDALQLLIGRGSIVGAKMTTDPRIAGILFTGSTETAKIIEKSLANREGPIGFLIAETGGQNAMIADSSILLEQTVFDVAVSAFNSAGQRCSALRVLFIQEDIADNFIGMLKGYMQTLTLGDPSQLSTDIGPVIDDEARKMLQDHAERMSREAKLVASVSAENLPDGSYFAPCVYEIPSLNVLQGEVFGPVLHIIRYKASELDSVMQSIIDTGFGLTLGVHSRIDSTIQYITSRMPIGNMYVNRNMIGAVVGVQPFGGEGLSGTGPKAGGFHYLPRLCVERTISTNTTAVGGNARLVSLLEEDE